MFKFYSSISGLSLDLILDLLKSNNFIIDWIAFCDDAIVGGWTSARIIERIDMALTDVYDISYRDEVLRRVKIYLVNKG